MLTSTPDCWSDQKS